MNRFERRMKLRGEPGSTVKLVVKRKTNNSEETLHLTVRRTASALQATPEDAQCLSQ